MLGGAAGGDVRCREEEGRRGSGGRSPPARCRAAIEAPGEGPAVAGRRRSAAAEGGDRPGPGPSLRPAQGFPRGGGGGPRHPPAFPAGER